MKRKLAELARRYDELTARMADPDIYEIQGAFQKVAKEAGSLEPLIIAWRRFESVERELDEAKQMLEEDDPEMRDLARAEITHLTQERETLEQEIRLLLLPKDPNDGKSVILEIRAGTGGEEATLFAADLFRMYSRYAEKQGWKVELLNTSNSDIGGFKEVVASIDGRSVFSTLKFEAGTHRVQRVPVTDSQGRIQTSACTVVVLPEAEEVELDIPATDIKIDVYRSSGPGGQSVNTTDSAVRITHHPTGLVVICQDEKSQHKNREKALKVLRARLLAKMEAEAHAERADVRRQMVGSGDRSGRIRTYNYPQNRVTDHRISLTLYKLDIIMQGQLDVLIKPLQSALQAELLSASS